jgi:hypothetical protein
MRPIFVGGLAAVAIVLWPDFSNAQTTSVLASSLTGSGIQAIDAVTRSDTALRTPPKDVPTVTKSEVGFGARPGASPDRSHTGT